MEQDVGLRTEDFYEQVDCLQICKLVVIRVNADAKEEARISPIYHLIVSELFVSSISTDS